MTKINQAIISLLTIIVWLMASIALANNSFSSSSFFIFLFRFLQISSALFGVIYLAGASLTSLFELILRRSYYGTLHFLITTCNSIFIVPVLILILVKFTGSITVTLVLSVYAFFILLWPLLPSSYFSTISFRSWRQSLAQIKQEPSLWIAFLVYFFVFLFTITRYPFLPALDTYSWVIAYENVTATHKLDFSAGLARTLFSILTQILYLTSKIPIYELFKYVFPFISLLFLPPLYLIAKSLRSSATRLLILLSPLASPVIIIELQTTRQQILLVFYLVTMSALIFLTRARSDARLLFLAFTYAAIGTFYHPAFAILVLPIALSLFFYFKPFLLRHKFIGLFLLLILFIIAQRLNIFSLLHNMELQFFGALKNFMRGRWNFSFPYTYRNSDGYDMGWSSGLGVLKYYAYYAGPFALSTILFISYLFSTRSTFRQTVKKYLSQPIYLPLIIIFIFFLSIAEIFPRFANIAYLPDRAWQFINALLPLFLTSVLYYLQRHRSSLQSIITYFGLFLVSIGIIGSTIVNNGYAHTIPPHEWTAATWIKNNLPENRLLLSSSSKNLIRYHSQSSRIHLDEKFITSNSGPELLNAIDQAIFPDVFNHPALQNFDDQLRLLDGASKRLSTNAQIIVDHSFFKDSPHLNKLIADVTSLQNSINPSLLSLDEDLDKINRAANVRKNKKSTSNIYIYYAKSDPLNPYIGRPYRSSFTGARLATTFEALDNNPDLFTPIYNDHDNVRIWQVHLPQNDNP